MTRKDRPRFPISEKHNLAVEVFDLSELHPALYNPREIDDPAFEGLSASISDFGVVELPVFNRRRNRLVAGHQRLKVLQQQGETSVAVIVGEWDETDEVDLNLILNNPAIQGRFTSAVGELLRKVRDRSPERFKRHRLDSLLRNVSAHSRTTVGRKDDEIPDPPKKPISKRGTIWDLGPHRLIVGDCTHDGVWKALRADPATGDLEEPDEMLLTDPPYCSGGFQESGKAAGSVGSRQAKDKKKAIARDQLSTRGYRALIKGMLEQVDGAGYAYVFTDWRMWINLYDLVESSGFGVRGMLVWDKGTPGMGKGWRHQHELILCACKVRNPFPDNKAAVGDVLQAKRTGNKLHTTEKPVDLICQILDVTTVPRTICDPFAGSGTTLIACERAGRRFRGVEVEPKHADQLVNRWEQLTGGKAKRRQR